MKVFKFGGASVKDAAGVRNVAKVLSHFPNDDLLIVVSAMGKTTNALEEVVWANADNKDTKALVAQLRDQHLTVLAEVAPSDERAIVDMEGSFRELQRVLAQRSSGDVDQDYDQIVSMGETDSHACTPRPPQPAAVHGVPVH